MVVCFFCGKIYCKRRQIGTGATTLRIKQDLKSGSNVKHIVESSNKKSKKKKNKGKKILIHIVRQVCDREALLTHLLLLFIVYSYCI